MARPKNYTVKFGNGVSSVSPKSLRDFLTSVASGTAATLAGKEVGTEMIDLSGIDQAKARTMLTQLFPVTTPPTATQTGAVVVATVVPTTTT